MVPRIILMFFMCYITPNHAVQNVSVVALFAHLMPRQAVEKAAESIQSIQETLPEKYDVVRRASFFTHAVNHSTKRLLPYIIMKHSIKLITENVLSPLYFAYYLKDFINKSRDVS